MLQINSVHSVPSTIEIGHIYRDYNHMNKGAFFLNHSVVILVLQFYTRLLVRNIGWIRIKHAYMYIMIDSL